MNRWTLLLLWPVVVAAAPADSPSPADAARAALARGDTGRALALADSAVEAAPHDAAGYAVRAAVHDARREFEKTVADCTKVLSLVPGDIAALHRRGEAHFRLGRFRESVADFDKEISLDPSREPHHWQRGISLYYAGEHGRGAKQFELHRTVNPDDVENAAWHYLCVARQSGADKARQSLLPVGADERVPMREIYEMFAGRLGPDDVIKAATANDPQGRRRKIALFYAHLYVGLFHEAGGSAEKSKDHLTRAAGEYAGDDYMGDVARVHAAVRQDRPKQ